MTTINPTGSGSVQISIFNYTQPNTTCFPVEEKREQEELLTKDGHTEAWKPIKKHPAWQVSTFGRIKDQYGKLKKAWPCGKYRNYRNVRIHGNDYRVHILVGKAFLPNPDNLPEIDHKNGKGWENYIWNLRWCTAPQNCMNRNKYTDKQYSSKYKGVSYNAAAQKWAARCQINGQCKYLGQFQTEEAAAAAYDHEIKKNASEFGVLNKVDDQIENLELKRLMGDKWSKRVYRKTKTTTRYYGVVKKGNRFYAKVNVNCKAIDIGIYDDEKDAARAVNAKKIELFGPSVKHLNEISSDEEEEDEDAEEDDDEEPSPKRVRFTEEEEEEDEEQISTED